MTRMEEIEASPERHRDYRLGRIHASEEILEILNLKDLPLGALVEVVKAWCLGAKSYRADLED